MANKQRIWDLTEVEAAEVLKRPLTPVEIEEVLAPLDGADAYTPEEVNESLGILESSLRRAGL